MKNDFKLCSVVVWFNPDEECLQNIKRYKDKVEKVYIIDNSTCDNSYLARNISNGQYIPNFKNLGIAAALNIGCKKALSEGFTWCMTMDQDSKWNEKELEKYIESAKEKLKQDEKIASFTPRLLSKGNNASVLGDLRRKLNKKSGKDSDTDFRHEFFIVTSGNIVSLAVWKEIGGYREEFFIDCVDFDFNIKLSNAGYKISFEDAFLGHDIGDNKRRLLPYESHSASRVYYIARNLSYLCDLYPLPEVIERAKYLKKKMLLLLWINLSFKKIHYYKKGIKDYKNNIKGELS